MRAYIVGGRSNHKNEFREIISGQEYAAIRDIHTFVENVLGGGSRQGHAMEGQATSAVYEQTDLTHCSVYYRDDAELECNIKGGTPMNLVLCSEKHNACPAIIISNNYGKEKGTVLWHLSYASMRQCARNGKNINNVLPKGLRAKNSSQPRSLATAFTSRDSKVIVTHEALLEKEIFSFNGFREFLALPRDLEIRSSGLEGGIRSYSLNYIPTSDTLVLSGYDKKDKHCFWLLKKLFTGTKLGENPWEEKVAADVVSAKFKEQIRGSKKSVSIVEIIQQELDDNVRNSAGIVAKRSPKLFGCWASLFCCTGSKQTPESRSLLYSNAPMR